MELLLRRLGAQRDDLSFAMEGGQITAASEEDEGDSETRDVRIETARRAVFNVVKAACKSAPELESGWFAVRYTG
jgi:hypothetical protein